METFLEKVPKDQNYLHFWFINAGMDLQNASNNFIQNKDELLKVQLESLPKAYADKRDSFASQSDMDEAGKILDGSVFKGDTQLQSQPAINMPSSMAEVRAAFANMDIYANGANSFISMVKDQVGPSFGDPELVRSFGDQVIKEYARTNKVSPSRAAGMVIRDLLNRNNEKIFSMDSSDSDGLSKSLKKISALVAALPVALSAGTLNQRIKVNSARGGSHTAVGESEIVSEILGKYQSWIGGGIRSAGETAGGMAFLNMLEEVTQQLGVVNSSLRTTSKNVRVDVKEDPTIKQMYAEANAMQKTSKASKGDVVVSVTKNGVTLEIPMTVHTPDAPLTANTISRNIVLHSGGSLLTFLTREAGLLGADMSYVRQLAAGHGDDFGIYSDASLDANWNMLMENVKYRGFVSALAGITAEEFSYFIAISGKIFTVGDFVNHIVSSGSAVNFSNLAKGVDLSRGQFVALNKWGAPDGAANTMSGILRSQSAGPSVSSLLQSTKVQVDVNLTQISSLFKNVLN